MNKIEEIRAKLAEAAHQDKVEDNQKIRELGLDSLDVVELLLQLEEEYGVSFDDVDMGSIATVKDLLAEVEKQL